MSRSLVLALLLSACSGGDEEDAFDVSSIPSGPLQGVIGGEAWSFGSGITDSFLSDDSDFFTTFYALDDVGCDDWSVDGGNHLLGSVPTSPGAFAFDLSQNVTFYIQDTNENLVATEGGIVVDSVDGGIVRGAMLATYDADNEVGGSFEVAICEDTSTF